MKRTLTFALLASLVLAGCGKYDDTNVRKDISDLKNRVTTLESAVDALEARLEAGSLITSVTPLPDDSGYRIEFTGGSGRATESIDILHGTDGNHGNHGNDGKDGAPGAPGKDGDSYIYKITDNKDGTITIVLNDAAKTPFVFEKASTAIRFEIMTVSKVTIREGATGTVKFVVNPSNGWIPTSGDGDMTKWELNTVETRTGYVNASTSFSVAGVEPSGTGEGEYTATILCEGGDAAITDYYVALVLNTTSEDYPALVSSSPFLLGAVPLPETAAIPAGEFAMGRSDGSNVGDLDGTGLNTAPANPMRPLYETPEHKVELTEGFHMTKYEITNAQYVEFLNDMGVRGEQITLSSGKTITGGLCTWGENNGRHMIYDVTGIHTNNLWGVNWDSDAALWRPWPGYENHPVIFVTWYGATEYARWLGGALPTEAQWEYACRAGTRTSYYFGDDESRLGDYAWYSGNCPGPVSNPLYGTKAVGQKMPNAWGLYDMHGNVFEWCADSYDSSYYRSSPVTDPTGPESGDVRVLRGGAWGFNAAICYSVFRNYHDTSAEVDYNYNCFGFRVVLPIK